MFRTWLQGRLERFRKAMALRRLARWQRPLANTDSARMATAIDSLPPRETRLWPATVAYWRLRLAQQYVEEGNLQGFRFQAGCLASSREWYPCDGEVVALAQHVGRSIRETLSQQTDRSTAVARAACLFARFRQHAAEPVPEMFALVEEMARLGCGGPVALRMYREYLACSSQSPGSPERQLVEGTLNAPLKTV
jgi:hypothetical protein